MFGFAATAIDTSDLHWTEDKKPMTAAHRAGPYIGIPENSLKAMQSSYDAGIRLLEVDVRRLRDGTLVLFHDNSLNRLYGEAGQIKNQTTVSLAGKKLLDFRKQPTDVSITGLNEALNWLQSTDAILLLDLKRKALFKDVSKAVTDASVQNRVVFITYSLNTALDWQSLAPWSFMSVPFKNPMEVDNAVELGLDMKRTMGWLGTKAVDTTTTSMLHDHGVLTSFGTLGWKPEAHDKQIKMKGNICLYKDFTVDGVDIITTDRPRTVHAVLSGRVKC